MELPDPELEVVALGPEDADRLIAFHEDLAPEVAAVYLRYGQVPEAAIRYHLAQTLTGDSVAFGLVSTDRIIHGIASLVGIRTRTPHLSMALDRGYQGSGWGSQMAALVLGYADRVGVSSVRLEVVEANPRAIRFYERLGFILTRRTDFEWTEDAWEMVRALQR